MDGEESRRRGLEAGREMLARYKASRSFGGHNSRNQSCEPSDAESSRNESEVQPVDSKGATINEGSSRDVTHSSVSMSEGEGEGDLEGMAGRVAELEELLQGKEAVVEALHAEIDNLRGEASSPNSSQSRASSINYKDVILTYHTKLQEFERAVGQRDSLIEDLTASLEQALSTRDALLTQLNALNSSQMINQGPPMDNTPALQEKISMLENTVREHKTTINELNSELARSCEQTQRLQMEKETQLAEINDYKLQLDQMNERIRAGAAENNLNIAETLEQQKQYETRVDKIKKDMQVILEKFTIESNVNTARHQKQIKDLETRHEANVREISDAAEEQLKSAREENKMLADRLNRELPDLESRHARELSVFQTQLANYKKTVEALKLELMNYSEAQRTAQAELGSYKMKIEELGIQAENDRRLLQEQIKLHKIQLDEMTSKYVAASSVLDSKESIERSLEQALTNATTLRQENDALRFQIDDLSARYSAAQSLIENNQAQERSMNSKIFDLEKSLSRLSGISVSTLSEFNETTYQTFDDVAIQYHVTRQKLEEKSAMEKQLVERINGLENDVRKANEELEKANLTRRSYEKELKDMKNASDKRKSEVNFSKDSNSASTQVFQGSLYFGTGEENKREAEVSQKRNDPPEVMLLKDQIDLYEQENKDLQEQLHRRDVEHVGYTKRIQVLNEKLKRSEEECEQLKKGLTAAWEQLNQTQATNDSRINDSNVSLHGSTSHELTKEDVMNVDESSSKYEDESIVEEKEVDVMDHENLRAEIDALKIEKEVFMKENQILHEKLRNYEEIVERIEQLEQEKDSLIEKQKELVEKHAEEICTVKSESADELQKVESLLSSLKEGTADLGELKTELETRHAKEVEELRTYFEQKCLQMEKQYSEEVFSQQSKKLSDNDSEVEELTEDLYFGGGGDCLNVSNVSGHSSRIGTPVQPNNEHRTKIHAVEETTECKTDSLEKTLQRELELKAQEIENIRSQYEKKLEDQRKLHEKERQLIQEKSGNVTLLKAVNKPCQTEWDPVAQTELQESGELTELRAAYSHQLEEQVALARLDIVNALQEQIQALLAADDPDAEKSWPSELLELRNKFTEGSRREIQDISERHALELTRLKEEHTRNLARTIERHQEEIIKIKIELPKMNPGKLHHENCNDDLIRERDSLQRTCLTLKSLVGELINYFAMCEEEVNNTLISEVLKTQLSKSKDTSDVHENSQQGEQMQGDCNAETSKFSEDPAIGESLVVPQESAESRIKRVHFAPHSCGGIASIIKNGDDTLQDLIEDESKDVARELRVELENCLDRLKSEAAQILGVSSTPAESKMDVLVKQVLFSSKINEELTRKLEDAENMMIGYREESERLKMKIFELQQTLTAAENKKEIITEGYGEHEESGVEVTIQNLSQLQDKARSVLMNGGGESSYLLQLIEDLCRHGDRMADESKREKDDLQLQVSLDPTPTLPPYIHRACCRKIEAADKQLRATRKFLEEQASEREAERDESARQIETLREQLKEKEREKERDQRITTEPSLSPLPPTSAVTSVLRPNDIDATVEALESQMREMSSMMSDAEARKSETESELKAAVDKIWVLRDIITDLEQQVHSKTEREEALQSQIDQLEEVIAAQTKNQQELALELDSFKMGGENGQLNEHIEHLQEELRKHKISSEHFNVNSTVLKQMKIELRDMEFQLDKRTKELEALHMCGSSLSLSQPSEDVSIRDQIDASRCPTPDDPHSPPTLPLDQLLKLKEKMTKHARAEEVAFRRIKDLDMQLTAVKNQNEELQAEQEILQQTASEQLFQIEAMRGRLEQQKQSAPFAQRQATSRLELQLHEANAKLHSLERISADKDLQAKELKNQLDRTNKLLLEKEGEIASVIQTENDAIQKLRDRMEILEGEKKLLESKVGMQERAHQELPKLIDSMLADKNEEIDHLKDQLSKRDKQLEMYLSLNLDESQLRELMKQAEPKNSARTLSDILSINSECEDFPEAVREAVNFTQTLPHNMSNFKTPLMGNASKDVVQVSPMSAIDQNKVGVQVPRLELGSQSRSLSGSCAPHSQTSIGVDMVHSVSDLRSEESSVSNAEDTRYHSSTEQMNSQNFSRGQVSMEMQTHGGIHSSNVDKNNVAHCPKHGSNDKRSRDSTEELHQQRIHDLEKELTEIKEELEVKSVNLKKREAELDSMQRDLLELRTELKETIESLTQDKLFYKNQFELTQVSESKIKNDLLQVENTLKLKTEELREYRCKMQTNEKIIMELNNEYSKFRLESAQKEEKQLQNWESTLREKVQELKNLKEIILEKDITIETIETRNVEIENENKQLYEYKTKFESCKRELSDSQNEILRLTDGLNNRDLLIRRLEEMARRSSLSGASSPSDNKDQEIHHLQEYLKEKDKVIRQMSDDSKSLHRALETIQNKMKESGNVVELRKKLKEERRVNAELKEEIDKLRDELERLRNESPQQSEEDGEIEDMVQRELNLSARLDRQIMNAIESETEDGVVGVRKRIERHACNSLDIEPVDHARQDRVAQRYNDARLKLKQAYKVNEELIKLKDDLEIEREMLKSQVVEYENRILQIKSDLEEQSRKVGRLDEDLSRERDMVRNLKIQIQREQNVNQTAQIHDSELIAALRMAVESSLDAEEKLRRDLSVMRRENKNFEIQLSAMSEQMKMQKTDETPGWQNLLETEQKKYIMLAEEYEEEQRKNVRFRDSVRGIEAERNKYEKQLEVVNDEREKLASGLALAEGIKEHLETDLKRTKEELKGREEECEWLQKRINTMADADTKRQQQRTNEHNELKSLRRELANSREVMIDLEADMTQSKRELTKSIERNEQLAQRIEALTEKEAELNRKLTVAKEEEKRLKEVITDMQNDLQISVRRELELTDELQKERLCSEKNVPIKFVQKIKELNESVEKYSRDKRILHDKLTQAREEKEKFATRTRILESQMTQSNQIPTNAETVEKLKHFYGKYLRVDSRRKALTYQKRYLLCVVGGYQLSEENTISVLAQLTMAQRSLIKTNNNRKNPRVRFRCVVLAIISIQRMKWLIVRWRTGRRVGADAVLGNLDSFMALRTTRMGTNNHSPPVRDRPTTNGDPGHGGLSLEHYLERFMNIQQGLGLAMAEPGAGQVTSD